MDIKEIAETIKQNVFLYASLIIFVISCVFLLISSKSCVLSKVTIYALWFLKTSCKSILVIFCFFLNILYVYSAIPLLKLYMSSYNTLSCTFSNLLLNSFKNISFGSFSSFSSNNLSGKYWSSSSVISR